MTESQTKQIFPMGVVNATPNSFSDGNQFNSPESFKAQLDFLLKAKVGIVDIGAESTAPFNAGISVEEEWERLETCVLPNIETLKNFTIISFDTYKKENILRLIEEFKELGPILMWNDVSGDLSGETIEILESHPQLHYVYCHNMAPDRESTHLHMDYAQPEKSGKELIVEDFLTAKNLLEEKVLFDRLWWDPCFGFSKTKEQNEEIMAHIPKIADEVGLNQWLLGISKKSFLRSRIQDTFPGAKDLPKERLMGISELLHLQWVQYWAQTMPGPTAIRLHDPYVLYASIGQLC